MFRAPTGVSPGSGLIPSGDSPEAGSASTRHSRARGIRVRGGLRAGHTGVSSPIHSGCRLNVVRIASLRAPSLYTTFSTHTTSGRDCSPTRGKTCCRACIGTRAASRSSGSPSACLYISANCAKLLVSSKGFARAECGAAR